MVEMAPGEEALAVQEAQVGVVRLRAGQPFLEELSAVWLAVQSLSFTLVCEPHDNLLLAEGSLRTLSRLCLEQLHLLGPGSEVRLSLLFVVYCCTWFTCAGQVHVKARTNLARLQ